MHDEQPRAGPATGSGDRQGRAGAGGIAPVHGGHGHTHLHSRFELRDLVNHTAVPRGRALQKKQHHVHTQPACTGQDLQGT